MWVQVGAGCLIDNLSAVAQLTRTAGHAAGAASPCVAAHLDEECLHELVIDLIDQPNGLVRLGRLPTAAQCMATQQGVTHDSHPLRRHRADPSSKQGRADKRPLGSLHAHAAAVLLRQFLRMCRDSRVIGNQACQLCGVALNGR